MSCRLRGEVSAPRVPLAHRELDELDQIFKRDNGRSVSAFNWNGDDSISGTVFREPRDSPWITRQSVVIDFTAEEKSRMQVMKQRGELNLKFESTKADRGVLMSLALRIKRTAHMPKYDHIIHIYGTPKQVYRKATQWAMGYSIDAEHEWKVDLQRELQNSCLLKEDDSTAKLLSDSFSGGIEDSQDQLWAFEITKSPYTSQPELIKKDTHIFDGQKLFAPGIDSGKIIYKIHKQARENPLDSTFYQDGFLVKVHSPYDDGQLIFFYTAHECVDALIQTFEDPNLIPALRQLQSDDDIDVYGA